MISQKSSSSCDIIFLIRNNLDTNSPKLIYYSLIDPNLTYCLNVYGLQHIKLKNLKTAQKISLLSLLATTQHPYLTDIFTAQNFLPLAKLIKLQEGMLAYKVKNGQNLLSNFLTDGHVDCHYQLRNDADLRIPLHARMHAQQIIRYRATKT